MNTTSLQHIFIAILPTLVVLIVGVEMLPSELAQRIVQESGPVETLSAIGYGVGACWLFWAIWQNRGGDVFAALMLVLLGLRELDFHALYTTMGIFKTRYYISPQVPLPEKMIVSVLVFCMIVAVIVFLRRNLLPFWSALKARQLHGVSVAMAIACAVLSKCIDSGSEPLRHLIAGVHSDPRTFFRVIEELLELAIPFYLLLAIFIYFTTRPATSR